MNPDEKIIICYTDIITKDIFAGDRFCENKYPGYKCRKPDSYH